MQKALTDSAIRLAKPRAHTYKMSDGRGLWLIVRPTGAKWWRFRYKFQGKENMISMGTYPDVPLSLARERREAARQLLAQGLNPSDQRKTEKAVAENTFEKVARHYLAKLAQLVQSERRSLSTYRKAKWMLETIVSRAVV